MIEFLITTLLFEKLRHWFKRKPRNNRAAIDKMAQTMPTFETVGELRTLLLNFSDSVPVHGGSFRYPHLQIRCVDGIGLINIGSSSHPSK